MQLHHESGPDGAGALRLAGDITIYHAAELKAALLALSASARDLTLDVGGVTEIDSAGIQLLLAMRRSLAESGAALRLEGGDGVVGEALSLYGMADAFALTAPVGGA